MQQQQIPPLNQITGYVSQIKEMPEDPFVPLTYLQNLALYPRFIPEIIELIGISNSDYLNQPLQLLRKYLLSILLNMIQYKWGEILAEFGDLLRDFVFQQLLQNITNFAELQYIFDLISTLLISDYGNLEQNFRIILESNYKWEISYYIIYHAAYSPIAHQYREILQNIVGPLLEQINSTLNEKQFESHYLPSIVYFDRWISEFPQNLEEFASDIRNANRYIKILPLIRSYIAQTGDLNFLQYISVEYLNQILSSPVQTQAGQTFKIGQFKNYTTYDIGTTLYFLFLETSINGGEFQGIIDVTLTLVEEFPSLFSHAVHICYSYSLRNDEQIQELVQQLLELYKNTFPSDYKLGSGQRQAFLEDSEDFCDFVVYALSNSKEEITEVLNAFFETISFDDYQLLLAQTFIIRGLLARNANYPNMADILIYEEDDFIQFLHQDAEFIAQNIPRIFAFLNYSDSFVFFQKANDSYDLSQYEEIFISIYISLLSLFEEMPLNADYSFCQSFYKYYKTTNIPLDNETLQFLIQCQNKWTTKICALACKLSDSMDEYFNSILQLFQQIIDDPQSLKHVVIDLSFEFIKQFNNDNCMEIFESIQSFRNQFTDFLQNDFIMKGYILSAPASYGGYEFLHYQGDLSPEISDQLNRNKGEFIAFIQNCLSSEQLGFESVAALAYILAETISDPSSFDLFDFYSLFHQYVVTLFQKIVAVFDLSKSDRLPDDYKDVPHILKQCIINFRSLLENFRAVHDVKPDIEWISEEEFNAMFSFVDHELKVSYKPYFLSGELSKLACTLITLQPAQGGLVLQSIFSFCRSQSFNPLSHEFSEVISDIGGSLLAILSIFQNTDVLRPIIESSELQLDLGESAATQIVQLLSDIGSAIPPHFNILSNESKALLLLNQNHLKNEQRELIFGSLEEISLDKKALLCSHFNQFSESLREALVEQFGNYTPKSQPEIFNSLQTLPESIIKYILQNFNELKENQDELSYIQNSIAQFVHQSFPVEIKTLIAQRAGIGISIDEITPETILSILKENGNSLVATNTENEQFNNDTKAIITTFTNLNDDFKAILSQLYYDWLNDDHPIYQEFHNYLKSLTNESNNIGNDILRYFPDLPEKLQNQTLIILSDYINSERFGNLLSQLFERVVSDSSFSTLISNTQVGSLMRDFIISQQIPFNDISISLLTNYSGLSDELKQIVLDSVIVSDYLNEILHKLPEYQQTNITEENKEQFIQAYSTFPETKEHEEFKKELTKFVDFYIRQNLAQSLLLSYNDSNLDEFSEFKSDVVQYLNKHIRENDIGKYLLKNFNYQTNDIKSMIFDSITAYEQINEFLESEELSENISDENKLDYLIHFESKSEAFQYAALVLLNSYIQQIFNRILLEEYDALPDPLKKDITLELGELSDDSKFALLLEEITTAQNIHTNFVQNLISILTFLTFTTKQGIL